MNIQLVLSHFSWDTKQHKPLEYLCAQRQTYNLPKAKDFYEQLLFVSKHEIRFQRGTFYISHKEP